MLERAGMQSLPPASGEPAGVARASFDAAVIDSYELPSIEICELARELPLATLAEANRCSDTGVLVDYHLDRGGEQPGKRLLPGPTYAPIDPIFAKLRRATRASVECVLITLGASAEASWPSAGATGPGVGSSPSTSVTGPGGDSSPSTSAGAPGKNLELALTAVRDTFPDARILTTARTPIAGSNIQQLPFPSLLSEVLDTVDVAVSAAGLSAYELACAGVPALLLPIAANQRRVAQACAAAGMAYVVDPQTADPLSGMREALDALRDPAARSAISKRGTRLFDGQGAARTARSLRERWKQFHH
jgi:spore coat polysaccharide biosynthesis predicted glycosyltransferase SpsG